VGSKSNRSYKYIGALDKNYQYYRLEWDKKTEQAKSWLDEPTQLEDFHSVPAGTLLH
jgi:hypothetical protein